MWEHPGSRQRLMSKQDPSKSRPPAFRAPWNIGPLHTVRRGMTTEHVCATCRVHLDYEEHDGTIIWIHPIGQVTHVDGVGDHDPVPVMASSVLETRARCDFCFAAAPAWRYPCIDFNVTQEW